MSALTLLSALLLCLGLGHVAAIPQELRENLVFLSCKDRSSACNVTNQFSPDDPEGDKYFDSKFAWILVRNKSSIIGRNQHNRVFHVLEPWLTPLERRNVIVLSALCDDFRHPDLCATYEPQFIYTAAANFTSVINIEENLMTEPQDSIFQAIRKGNKLPIRPTHANLQSQDFMKDSVKLLGLPREKYQFLISMYGSGAQEEFLTIDVGSILAEFGVTTFFINTEDADTAPKEKNDESTFHIFNLKKESGCDFNNILDSCSHIARYGLETTFMTAEEVACKLLQRGNNITNRKINAKNHDRDVIKMLLRVCPTVLVMDQKLTKNLPKNAVARVLKEHNDSSLLVVYFDSATMGAQIDVMKKMKESNTPAMIVLRKDRWTSPQEHVIDSSSKEALRHSMNDKMALYSHWRFTRPEMTYLRFKGNVANEQAFTLDNDHLYDEMLSNQEHSLFQANYIDKKVFRYAVKQSIVIIHFSVQWNSRSMASLRVINAAKKVLKERYNFTGLPITTVNCFSEDELCHEFGVTSYPTFKVFKNGVDKGLFTDAITVDNIVRRVLLNLKKNKSPIRTKDKWTRVVSDFRQVVDLIFLAVDLPEVFEKSFNETVDELGSSQLLIRASRAILPSDVQKALPKEAGGIVAFHLKSQSVVSVLPKAADSAEISAFVRNAKIGIVRELTMEGLLEIQQAGQPLLIAFSREIQGALESALTETAKSLNGQVVVRWMNASSRHTVSVMEAYGISHTPSIIFKLNEQVFTFSGSNLKSQTITAWTKEILAGKKASQYKLKTEKPEPLRQYLDHIPGIFDDEIKVQPSEDDAKEEATQDTKSSSEDPEEEMSDVMDDINFDAEDGAAQKDEL